MKNSFLIKLLFILLIITMREIKAEQNERVIKFEVIVNASVEEAYNAWTTKEGIQSFFAPECDIDIKLYGKYHIYFFPRNSVGTKGEETAVILSFQENNMLSFTWGFRPDLPYLRDNQKTVVMIRFQNIDAHKTKVSFTQSGWGEGDDWDKGYDYFKKAWKDVVFKRFVERFETGPVDWSKIKFKIN